MLCSPVYFTRIMDLHIMHTAIRSLAVIIGSILFLSGCNPTLEWKPFSPAGSGYTILMPGVPKSRTQMSSGIPVTIHMCEFRNFAFMTSSVSLPVQVEDVPDTIRLDNSRNGALQASGGRLIKETNIVSGGHPGREIKLETKELKITARIFLAHRMLFMLQVAHRGSPPSDADVARFFDSFQIIGAAPAATPASPAATPTPTLAGQPAADPGAVATFAPAQTPAAGTVPAAPPAEVTAPPLPPGYEPLSGKRKVVPDMKLKAYWGARWEDVVVLAVTSDGIKVHWVNWDSNFDEVLPRQRLIVAIGTDEPLSAPSVAATGDTPAEEPEKAETPAEDDNPFVKKADNPFVKKQDNPFVKKDKPTAETAAADQPDGAAPASEPAEDEPRFDVTLEKVGNKYLFVQQVLSESLQVDQNTAKSWTRSVPRVIKAGATRSEAEQLKTDLEEKGAKVSISAAKPKKPTGTKKKK